MLSFFLKQNRRKGFTLIELIVVIAIIAIMTAIAIPVLSSGDTRGEKGNSSAKGYYYAMQDIMTNFERSGGFKLDAVSGVGNDLTDMDERWSLQVVKIKFVYVAQIENGAITGFRAYKGTPEVLNGEGVNFPPEMVPEATEYSDLFDRMVKKINNKMAVSTVEDGFLYAVVDSNFRVEYAYWCEADLYPLIGQATKAQQTASNLCGEFVYGAFPESRAIMLEGGMLFDTQL